MLPKLFLLPSPSVKTPPHVKLPWYSGKLNSTHSLTHPLYRLKAHRQSALQAVSRRFRKSRKYQEALDENEGDEEDNEAEKSLLSLFPKSFKSFVSIFTGQKEVEIDEEELAQARTTWREEQTRQALRNRDIFQEINDAKK